MQFVCKTDSGELLKGSEKWEKNFFEATFAKMVLKKGGW